MVVHCSKRGCGGQRTRDGDAKLWALRGPVDLVPGRPLWGRCTSSLGSVGTFWPGRWDLLGQDAPSTSPARLSSPCTRAVTRGRRSSQETLRGRCQDMTEGTCAGPLASSGPDTCRAPPHRLRSQRPTASLCARGADLQPAGIGTSDRFNHLTPDRGGGLRGVRSPRLSRPPDPQGPPSTSVTRSLSPFLPRPTTSASVPSSPAFPVQFLETV